MFNQIKFSYRKLYLKKFNPIIRGLALIPQIERRYEKETSQSIIIMKTK